ncbi:hypothetical protein AVEN_202221-1 [Araneus ventricosus]|uniref:Uncharacterized protein n=1 Tax=Araneus ventricosus TaxID=182803 RepID=A0A4Y2VUX5_ARAVE|nr:hypothetical protein AVEN_202221-1 [Araneus ventricosus]
MKAPQCSWNNFYPALFAIAFRYMAVYVRHFPLEFSWSVPQPVPFSHGGIEGCTMTPSRYLCESSAICITQRWSIRFVVWLKYLERNPNLPRL